MYIFELISKIKNSLKKENSAQEETLEESCSHNFAPLDSTGKHFACTKCGFVVEKSELKNNNFFIQKN